MSERPSTIVAVADAVLRLSFHQALAALGQEAAVQTWDDPTEAPFTNAEAPDVVIADTAMLARFSPALRKSLRQAASQLLLIVSDRHEEVCLDDFAADATDVLIMPVEPEVLGLRLRRAQEIRRMRSELTSYRIGREGEATTTHLSAKDLTETARLRKRMGDLDRLKSNLITVIAHEFKTPIHLAAGYIELLNDGELGELSEEQQGAITTIKRQLKRLGDKVADIERIAQLEMGLPQDLTELVDIGVLIEQELDGFYPAFERKQLKPRMTFEAKLPQVRGCADFLADVFRRLIDNAIHYTPEGGSVELATLVAEVETEAVEGDLPAPQMVEIRVKDTGVGIPEHMLPHLFDRFGEFRDIEHHSSQRSGLGLGLAICRHLVELHEGTISVASTPGEGSTFTVRLPAA